VFGLTLSLLAALVAVARSGSDTSALSRAGDSMLRRCGRA